MKDNAGEEIFMINMNLKQIMQSEWIIQQIGEWANGWVINSLFDEWQISFWIWDLGLSSPKTAGGQTLQIKYFMLLIFVNGKTMRTEIWLTFLFFEHVWWGDSIAWYCRGA